MESQVKVVMESHSNKRSSPHKFILTKWKLQSHDKVILSETHKVQKVIQTDKMVLKS